MHPKKLSVKPHLNLVNQESAYVADEDEVPEPYECYKDICCGFPTGRHCLWKTSESKMNEFGNGFVLYFKFIKLMSACFLVFTILSIFTYYVCI